MDAVTIQPGDVWWFGWWEYGAGGVKVRREGLMTFTDHGGDGWWVFWENTTWNGVAFISNRELWNLHDGGLAGPEGEK